jgi:asparagine synthase (glutamine-hydrolysing)
MCGIAGQLRLDGISADAEVVKRMMARLARRGPEGEGFHLDGPLGMGHRRLAIIDLSERSRQPMVDISAGLALVFNGTIYNYPQLRSELIDKGHIFQSDGDTEVILRAYAEWGEACVERLHGAFAFALWNRNTRSLFLARDRLGIKPLYFSQDAQRFLFASTPQAILTTGGVDTNIDPVALHHHLTLHAVVPAPHTILLGIRKLAPASTMTIDQKGQIETRCYWRVTAQRPEKALKEEDWVDAIHDSLRAAVRKRLLISDVKVGVLLSGGLDSSLLVALLAEQGVEDLLTFSVGFEDQPEERGNEFEYSDIVAERFRTRHHQFHIPNDQVLARLPEAVENMAEPMVSQDAVAFYLLAEQVSKTVKVVQSGQGADEVFGGYYWYEKMNADLVGSPLDRFRRYYFDRDHAEYLETVHRAYHGIDHTAYTIYGRLTEPGADTFMDQVLRMDTTMLITDDPVKRVDNMTMAWGLEARVPFLDHELVELAARMPPELKLASGGKHILKRIARGRVPDAVIDRSKGYFPMPALKFVRGEFLAFMRSILNSQACRNRNLFQRDYIKKLLAAPDQHLTRIQGSKLWHLALLEFWLQRNVDRKL